MDVLYEFYFSTYLVRKSLRPLTFGVLINGAKVGILLLFSAAMTAQK